MYFQGEKWKRKKTKKDFLKIHAEKTDFLIFKMESSGTDYGIWLALIRFYLATLPLSLSDLER